MMKIWSWIDQKDEICRLIQGISCHYGGDDIEWLRDYAMDVIHSWSNDLDIALACFMDLDRQLAYASKPMD